jgi:hypothetical protein
MDKNLRYKDVPTKELEKKAEEISIKARVTPQADDDGKPDTEDMQLPKATAGTDDFDLNETGAGD